jgi:RimJ/RimL family protein N-acetyltransferase
VGGDQTVSGKRVALGDGSIVLIRQVQPRDAPLLADGFARLSAESRRLRFLTSKSELFPAELRYFTEIDHNNHEALGALDQIDGRGLGIARYIRQASDPEAAEIAVVVVDDWQRRGLGTELLNRLTDRARREGIRRFTALVAADNLGIARLLGDIGDVRTTKSGSGTVEYEVALPPQGLGDGLRAMMRAFGRRQLKSPLPIQEALAALVPDRFPPHEE